MDDCASKSHICQMVQLVESSRGKRNIVGSIPTWANREPLLNMNIISIFLSPQRTLNTRDYWSLLLHGFITYLVSYRNFGTIKVLERNSRITATLDRSQWCRPSFFINNTHRENCGLLNSVQEWLLSCFWPFSYVYTIN